MAQGVTVGPMAIVNNGARQVQFPADVTNYYVLYRGTELTNIVVPVQMALGVAPTTELVDISTQTNTGFYRVRTIPRDQPLNLDGDALDDVAELLRGTDPLAVDTGLVINEVDYDQPGTDTAEFVEILNVTTNTLDLSGLALIFINGANNQQYFRTNLSGTLTNGQYLVIGTANVTVPNGARFIQFANASDNVQNGSPDGVLIFNTLNNRIVDALSYEGSITAAIITGVPGTHNLVEGIATTASDATSGSLIRDPNGTDADNASNDWKFTTTLTPGSANIP